MFTGIVQGCQPVVAVDKKPGLISFTVELAQTMASGVRLGASIAIDGVCLTVAALDGARVRFDAMQETLDRTTIGTIQVGQRVNVERSAALGDEIGGHIVSGHVTGVAEIIRIDTPENNKIITFKLPPASMKYIFSKGFIALDGASLTTVAVDKQASTVSVHLIPETLRLTTFGSKEVGSLVNFEIDSRTQTIVDTIAALYAEGSLPQGQTV